MEQFKAYALKFSIMSILAIAGPKFFNQYVIKYTSFLGATGSEYVASFIVIFILLMGTHFLTKAAWAV